MPAQQEAAERSALCDPNRGPDITVSLPGMKPNTGPISNLVFHKIWQLVSDDKLTKTPSPTGNLWQCSSTPRAAKFLFLSVKCCTDWEVVTQRKTQNECVHCCLAAHSGFLQEAFSMIYSASLNYRVYMIDEQWNSPLEVERSRCSVKTLVCHYIHL